MELEVARAEAGASRSPGKVCGWDSDYLEQGSVEDWAKKSLGQSNSLRVRRPVCYFFFSPLILPFWPLISLPLKCILKWILFWCEFLNISILWFHYFYEDPLDIARGL